VSIFRSLQSAAPRSSHRRDDGPSPWALVLAGGDGTRLQGLTALIAGRPIPKQYCRILGGESLLEGTLARIAPLFPAGRTLAVVNRDHLHLALPQLGTLPADNLLVQPRNRDTGPGILLGLLKLRERAGDPIVALFPSDHFVADAARFRRYVAGAMELARSEGQPIVLLGIRPDRADPGFGYIRPAQRVAAGDGMAAFRVAGFSEKPSHEAALDLVRRGGLWSSFVMVFRLRRMLDILAALRPEDHARVSALLQDPQGLDAHYGTSAPWSFSHEVLARIPAELVALRAENTGWSDWGTREAIERTLAALAVVPPWQAAAGATPASASTGG
jgi:mannose-1-phosphate guanylyltransferase